MIDVYLEVGSKRVFAGALEWPGWCRNARDEASALRALLEYGGRYRAAVGRAARGLELPRRTSSLRVVERLDGNTTTDFGVPARAPARDADPTDDEELARLGSLLEACWSAFDAAAKTAGSATLRTGPRGGGRDLAKMTAHVFEGERSYLSRLGGSFRGTGRGVAAQMAGLRTAFLDALAARARGELPDDGPRGGARWSARYAVRRSAWHALDHAWEIEDRST